MTKVKLGAWSSVDNIGFVDVKESPYFATGDGATDDTAAFVAAFATGKPVFVPAGTYIATGLSLPSSLVMFGVGAASILKLKAAANTAFVSLLTKTNIRLYDFAIDGNKAVQAGSYLHGLAVSAGSGHIIQNVLISNTLGDGLNVTDAATDIYLRDVQCTGFVKSGFTFEDILRIHVTGCIAYSSDAAAFPGDGFALAPAVAGDALASVVLTECRSRSNVGRGFAAVGFGSKNVQDVIMNGCVAELNTSHGFHALTAKQILVSTCVSKSNGGDGYRLEGDTVDSRFVHSIANTNTGFGIREIIAGSTPDRNDLVGMVCVGNGSNVVTKVGAASLIPY